MLTFRALRLMQKADVVVYDNLVSEHIVEMTRGMYCVQVMQVF